MLTLRVPGKEFFNEKTGEFVKMPETVLEMENSLLAISKWESRFHKPYFSEAKDDKTTEEWLYFFKCMTINQKSVNDSVYIRIAQDKELTKKIIEYINDPMTATTFSKHINDNQPTSRREGITNELIYYWMKTANIPIEFEKWHINRLFTLLRICGIKDAPPKKMSARQITRRNAALNAARRKNR